MAGPPENFLPRSLKEAIGIGNNEDPLVVAALYREQSAKYLVERIRGELLPTVELQASYDDRFGISKLTDEVETGSVVGRAIIPIYEAGDVYARVRQAKQNQLGFLQQIEQVRTQQKQVLVASWAQLEAARAQLNPTGWRSNPTRWRCRACARRRRSASARCSTCSTPSSSISTRRSRSRRRGAISSWPPITSSAMGRLDAAWIGAAAYVYDPVVHYKEVRRKWFGLSITHSDGRARSSRPSRRPPTRAGTRCPRNKAHSTILVTRLARALGRRPPSPAHPVRRHNTLWVNAYHLAATGRKSAPY